MEASRCITLVAALFLPVADAEATGRRPNVVFILTDNHGAWTLGCYGNPDIRTPHIDRLAAEGVRFANAFCNNGVCSPTRATYLTGLMPSQHGVHNYLTAGRLQTGPEARNTLSAFRSLPEILKDEGYACGLVGKWHLGGNGSPQEGLEDYWITMPHGATGTFHGAQVIENGRTRKEPTHLTTFWTGHAVRFIEQNAQRPFFLYLAYNGPYGLSRYQIEPLRGPRAADYENEPIASFPGGVIHPWQFNNREYFGNATAQRRYAAELSSIDDGVGAVMGTLERLGLGDDTLVIFAADQGWAGGQLGLWGMGDHTRPLNAFDPSMRIPLIFHHRGGIPGGRVAAIHTSNYDFLPSVLGYLGIAGGLEGNPPSPGRDYSPLLRGGRLDGWKDEVFYDYENLRCIRTPDWKFVERFGDGLDELYHLREDPGERRNLAGLTKHHPTRNDLRERLHSFFARFATAEYDLWNGGGSQTRTIVWGREGSSQRGRIPSRFDPDFRPPPMDLPEGFVAEVAAAPPLVRHPMAATHDDRGRLFVAEAAGVNLKKEDLERERPNFVRMLEDLNADGIYDRSTVFADRMTFPQGVLWHDGSLFVASPPSIWKLTDTDDDGVADVREEIATGFDYTGNAADVHGPFAGPDGRIYWCHGRKNHEVFRPDGSLVSRGRGARIWSCRPDGSGIEAYAGGGMDNPVEIDFTPEGEMIGTANLFYGRPRGDVLVHWMRGGKYPRRDQAPVLGEFKSTGPLLEEAHNFGHVAVSGMCITRGPHFRNPSADEFDVLTSFFNTQEIERTTLGWDGATPASRRSGTLVKVHDPDVHLTDVLEDRDGSILIVDTGGWFRIGCPTSRIAKPEIPGAIYRIRPAGPRRPVERPEPAPIRTPAVTELLASVNGGGDRQARRAAEALGRLRVSGAVAPLVRRLAETRDRSLQHSLLWALIEIDDYDASTAATREWPDSLPAALWALDQMDSSQLAADTVLPFMGKGETAVAIARKHPEWAPAVAAWFAAEWPASPETADAFLHLAPAMLDNGTMREIVTGMLRGDHAEQSLAWEVLAGLPEAMTPPKEWREALRRTLADRAGANIAHALRAARRLPATDVDAALGVIANDSTVPPRIRLLSLRSLNRGSRQLDAESFSLLVSLLGDGASPSDRAAAVAMLQSHSLNAAQLVTLAAMLPEAGPIEFPGLLQAFARNRSAEVGEALAKALTTAPAAGSIAPTELERALNRYPPESTTAAHPRLAALQSEVEARLARLDELAGRAGAAGDPARGRRLFESGAGACITCHQVAERGVPVGPDLTTIGRIRSPRDLLESILFPNASLARGYEAYVVETTDGASVMGLIRSESQASFTLALPAGATLEIRRDRVRTVRAAPVSLMPSGLEEALEEGQLLDLVAYLGSLR